MFTREEKVILLEAIKTKIHRTYADLEKTNNEEIKAKKQKRLEVLYSCKMKILSSKEVKK